MKNILDRLALRATGLRKENPLMRQPLVQLQAEPTGKMRHGGFQPMEEYELTAKLIVSFWSNQVMFEDSRKAAESVLLHGLYDGTLGMLAEAKHAIFNGDGQRAIEIISEIQQCLTQP